MPIILTILLFNSPLAGISQDGGEDGIEGVTSDYSVALDYVKGELSDAYTRLHVIPGLPSERLEKKYILDIDTCMDFFSSQGAEPLYQKLLLEAAMYDLQLREALASIDSLTEGVEAVLESFLEARLLEALHVRRFGSSSSLLHLNAEHPLQYIVASRLLAEIIQAQTKRRVLPSELSRLLGLHFERDEIAYLGEIFNDRRNSKLRELHQLFPEGVAILIQDFYGGWGGCMAGGIPTTRVFTDPPGARIRLISDFSSLLCRARGLPLMHRDCSTPDTISDGAEVNQGRYWVEVRWGSGASYCGLHRLVSSDGETWIKLTGDQPCE